MLAVDRVRPCPWCGVPAGKPCRADRGRGGELTKTVHTFRKKPAEPAEQAPTEETTA
jgi:uncharacterized protein YcbX